MKSWSGYPKPCGMDMRSEEERWRDEELRCKRKTVNVEIYEK